MITSPDVDHLHPKVRREWLHNRHIVIYTVFDVSRTVVDVWAEAVIDLMEKWPPDRAYLAIYDVSNIPSLTPYARKRAEDIARVAANLAHIDGAYAVVLKRNFLSMIIRLFVLRDLPGQNPKFKRRVFFDRDEALAWLEEFLATAGAN